MSPDLEKFVRKVSRTLEDRILDKKARAKGRKLTDQSRCYHEGEAQGFAEAVAVLRSMAKGWVE